MKYVEPGYSKKRVNAAGKALVAGPGPIDPETIDPLILDQWLAYFQGLDVISNWRASHQFPLNTFQVGLRARANRLDTDPIIAQRIKRLSSIHHKLERFPTMTLSQMQDIGGCRAIVSSIDAVTALVEDYAR